MFERWPVDAVFGMHNMPGLELGKLHFRDGAMMAAVDNWEIELTGKGSHGSMPELSIDPVVAGSSLVMALQTIVSRNVSPHNSAVVTVGAFIVGQRRQRHRAVGDPAPVDPHDDAGGSRAGAREGAVDHEGASGSFRLHLRNPGGRAGRGAGQRPGAKPRKPRRSRGRPSATTTSCIPGPSYLGSEDFAFMLQKKQGTYCLLGNGDTPMVHHPQYVFNDGLLPVGAAYWVAPAEGYLR